MNDFTFSHFVMEFINTGLALAVAGGGFYLFIVKENEKRSDEHDKKFATIFKVTDSIKLEYVRKEIFDREVEHIKELNRSEIKSLLTVFQTELKYVNEKLDTLIKHDEKRNS
jgi:hypothetical protein